jgi:hypothetical protein
MTLGRGDLQIRTVNDLAASLVDELATLAGSWPYQPHDS